MFKRLHSFGRVLVLAGVCLALDCCGGSGSKSAADVTDDDGPRTPEEQEAVDKDPGNVNVPPEVVPDEYQGEELLCVELRGEASYFSATGMSSMSFSFTLKQAGAVTAGRVVYETAGEDPVQREFTSGGAWIGWTPEADTKSIKTLSISATDAEGNTFTLQAEDIPLTDKAILGSSTVYTGSLPNAYCTSATGDVMALDEMDTSIELVYKITGTK